MFGKRKKLKEEARRAAQVKKTQAIKELREFRDLGETFNYLGRVVLVTAHTRLVISYSHLVPSYVLPELRGDYADEHGVLRPISFSLRELSGLKKQNP